MGKTVRSILLDVKQSERDMAEDQKAARRPARVRDPKAVAKTADLGPLAEMVGVQLRLAQISADRALAEKVGGEVPPGYFTVLALIAANPGASQSAVAAAMALDRSSLVPILKDLERRRWITRAASTRDRRAHELHLTVRGRTALARLRVQIDALEAQIREVFGAADTRRLLAALRQFQAMF